MRRHAHMYEINACVFINRMSQKYGRTLTLATVPDEEWQLLAGQGFDLVWLMGVWQRSSGARQQALLHPALRREYGLALPNWTDDDVGGSPYAVYSYELDTSLGRPAELAQLKSKLNRQGLSLILDFVPNHLALDHPWTRSHPWRFIQGKERDAQAYPDRFFLSDGCVYFAHGRDPNFPPWTDTVQVNFYSPDLRHALVDELLRIAEVADGVRCDMAMLALNDVFQKVWGEFGSRDIPPKTEFWAEAIDQMKRRHPGFVFLAEAYWGLERKLQQIGFDFAYDKLLYDRLRFFTARDIRSHLTINDLYQQRAVRFVENHDEERAIVALGRDRSLAAAVVLATVPGLRLFHDGQLEGRRIRLPIQLVREPQETADPDVRYFYSRLLMICNSPAFHEGEWMLMEPHPAGAGDNNYHNLLAWCWRYAERYNIVVVNYSAEPCHGRLQLPLELETTGTIMLCDELTGKTFAQDTNEIDSQGLYVELAPWEAQILGMTFNSADQMPP